ncbi:MAG TPA: 3-deoxy-manno-octulosonate cytidylyltransferase [Acidobacteriota bacterium]|nr:3-deoxy-manno-octulosonate cytidylyltransferase [Acidobacteriota bacterium]
MIPARMRSSRFAGKPLALLAGRPMIQHVAERCAAVDGVGRVIVATDDERIVDAAMDVGVEAMMTPASLASGTDRVAHVAEQIECSVVLNIQGDEPLIDPDEVSGALASFSAGGYDYGTLRAPLIDVRDRWDPNVVKVVVDNVGRALYFSRAPLPFPRDAWQAASNCAGEPLLAFDPAALATAPCWIHVGVYLYTHQALAGWARIPRSQLEQVEGLEQLRVLEAGKVIQTFPVAEAVPGVDTPEDLERVQRLLEEH